MNLRQLARSSFRFYFRSHLGVLAGTALAATVLIGALAVGDSVQEGLKLKAWRRIGAVAAAIHGGDRFFRSDIVPDERFRNGPALIRRYEPNAPTAAILRLSGTVTRQDGTARANRIQVVGVRDDFEKLWNVPLQQQSLENRHAELGGKRLDPPPTPYKPFQRKLVPNPGTVNLSPALARQLGAKEGDALVVRIQKPSALSRDAVISPRDDQSVALRVTVSEVLTDAAGGISLEAVAAPPLTVFMNQFELATKAGIPQRANLLLRRSESSSGKKLINGWPQREARSRFQGFLEGELSRNPPRFPEILDNLWRRVVRALSFWNQPDPWQVKFHLRPAGVELIEANRELADQWTLDDAELSVHGVRPQPSAPASKPAATEVELNTRRIFLEAPAIRAALTNRPAEIPAPTAILTYLVNSLEHGNELTPYSMVTAAGAPYTPADLHDDEIVVTEWLANDLHVHPGDSVAIAYYRVDTGSQLVERTNTFKVRSIVPMQGVHADRTLMPEFPGLSKAESTRDWDAGFDLVHPIRDKDEAYWKQWRGTPKAFISLAAGQAMWGNRFGNLTAIRWPVGETAPPQLVQAVTKHIRANLDPADVGLRFTDVRTPALAAAETGTGKEFGGLMIGFSFFLIVSALLLTAMLFSFSLEQRAVEIGTLLALGWQPRQVRRVLFREGMGLAVFGSLLGTAGGIGYAKAVLWGLSTLWRDAVGGAGLEFHLTAMTLMTGILSGVAVAALTLGLTLRRQTNRPARELLNEGASETAWQDPAKRSRWPLWLAWVCGVGGIGMAGASIALHDSNPETYFSAGSLLLIGVLLGIRESMARPVASTRNQISLGSLAIRGMTRRTRRSLGTVSLLSSAAFLIVAVATNRLDARRDATQRNSGTGGFALWAESSLPVIQDLNTPKGQEFYGLDRKAMKEVSFVPMRVRDGDDASCLNLNRAQHPRLLGVNPELLAQRGAFTFTDLAKGISATNGWLALGPGFATNQAGIDIIPAIGDANSLQWALQKSLGDTLDYVDQRGRPFQVRIVGAVANSILQGSLIISETDFEKHFQNESGHRALLIDAPATAAGEVASQLTRALQDTGLEVVSTATRLDRFNAVQNTYLNTFQVLGGLGLLLGSVGLGVVVSRNVFERRGELAVLQAMGFQAAQLRRFVLIEHGALLLLGLGSGLVAALLTVLPALLTPGSEFPWSSIGITLGVVALNGLAWTWLATRRALRTPLLDSLRAL